MPRFFFNLCSQTEHLPDPEGVEMPDAEAARIAALDAARDIIAADARSGTVDMFCRIEVENDAREIIQSLPFCEAVTFISPLLDKLAN